MPLLVKMLILVGDPILVISLSPLCVREKLVSLLDFHKSGLRIRIQVLVWMPELILLIRIGTYTHSSYFSTTRN